MTRPTIILVHGMGHFKARNDPDPGKSSFYQEFVDAANAALLRYPNHDGKSIEDKIDLHEVFYNDIFDEQRERMAAEGQKISRFIGTLSGAGALTAIPGLIARIAGFEASLNDDDFFYTHWLDVLFYKTYLGEYVRARTAEKISDIIGNNYRSSNVHIIAHSLGTAVVHDTLHKLYRGDYQGADRIHDLSPTTHKIKSLWMLANISRLANSVLQIGDPHDSIVRPGSKGMTEYMFNCRHALDPFTWPRRFDPPNDGSWVPGRVFGRFYADIKTTLITNKNTHSFSQYIQDPEINFPLFQLLLGMELSLSDKDVAIDRYDDHSLQDAYTELKGALTGFPPPGSGDLGDLVEAAHKLRNFIEIQGARR